MRIYEERSKTKTKHWLEDHKNIRKRGFRMLNNIINGAQITHKLKNGDGVCEGSAGV